MVQLPDVALARYRLANYLTATPVEEAPLLGKNLFLKLENTNRTHSFKVRGALNALLALDASARARGIIAASSGNHAQGVAYAASLLGIQARIVMPVHTPKRKLAGVKRFGAEAVLHGELYHEAEQEARRIEREDNSLYISPYNDPHIVAGAGTVGLELLDVLPDLERVIVPVGGGGLISGIAVAIKGLRPQVEIIGVNATAGPAMYNLFYNTSFPDSHDTLAEALPGEIEAGSITADLARRYVDRIVLVSEEAIADAMRFMVLEQGWIVEGGGAVGIAAVRSGAVAVDGRKTAIVVSGGNVDGDTLKRVLNAG
ncbi:MAG: threonine/serine dehydratase [Chloroflexota bacterium]